MGLLLLLNIVFPAARIGDPQTTERFTPSAVYELGSGDQITIRAFNVEELSEKAFRIDGEGHVNLALVGTLTAAGLTVPQLEAQLATMLARYVKRPEVSIFVSEYASRPVAVMGAVNTPGVLQLRGPQTLIETISLAGGFRADAGYRVKVTRRSESGTLAAPTAITDASKKTFTADILVKDIIDGREGAANFPILPHDIVSVPKAQVVYVIGEVHKPGGFALGESETLSVLKAVSLAEGVSRAAAGRDAKILRAESVAPRRAEIGVDLNRILSGQADDVQMQPEDILFVPTSKAKTAALRSLEAALQIGTGIVIYRR
jgi:polysaccharide export outer membrane protein